MTRYTKSTEIGSLAQNEAEQCVMELLGKYNGEAGIRTRETV